MNLIKPIVVAKGAEPRLPPLGLIRDDDAVIFFNFRADRARQMTYALAAPDFDKFADAKRPKNLFYVGMTQYDKNWPWLKYVIAPEKTWNTSWRKCLRNCNTRICVPRRRKNTPRHLFFQRRRREAICRRGADSCAIAKSGHVRF